MSIDSLSNSPEYKSIQTEISGNSSDVSRIIGPSGDPGVQMKSSTKLCKNTVCKRSTTPSLSPPDSVPNLIKSGRKPRKTHLCPFPKCREGVHGGPKCIRKTDRHFRSHINDHIKDAPEFLPSAEWLKEYECQICTECGKFISSLKRCCIFCVREKATTKRRKVVMPDGLPPVRVGGVRQFISLRTRLQYG